MNLILGLSILTDNIGQVLVVDVSTLFIDKV